MLMLMLTLMLIPMLLPLPLRVYRPGTWVTAVRRHG
jgi:hypothetical protein